MIDRVAICSVCREPLLPWDLTCVICGEPAPVHAESPALPRATEERLTP